MNLYVEPGYVDAGYFEGDELFIDTHDGFWTKQWIKAAQRNVEKRKETIDELEEVLEQIEEQIQEVRSAPVVAVDAPQMPDFGARIELIEKLIAQRKRVLADIEDEEEILLLM